MRGRSLACGAALATAFGAATILSAQPQPVVRSGTALIRVTILARDHSGKPVTRLTAADFSVTEDGKPQTVAFFDANGSTAPTTSPLAAAHTAPSATAPASPDAGGTAFSNSTAGDRVRNVTVILLDRLNTVWSDQAQARDGIAKFLSKVRPDDRVALYALDGTSLRVLHDFTADAASLLKAVNSAARITSPSAEGQNRYNLADLGHAAGEYQDQLIGAAAYTTITAFQTIGQHLDGVPGRKSLVWISSAFPIGGPNSPMARRAGTSDTVQIQRATRALNTAGISVYPIDARGLIGAFSDPGTATRPPTYATLDTVSANTEVMHSIADDTGGRVFLNTNDIGGAVRSAIDDADAYYVIGYYPPAAPDDGRYRQIDVKTRAPGVDLRFRHGYFAAPAGPAGGDRTTTLERALRDVLDATGIPVSVHVAPTGATQDAALSIAADGRALTLRNDQGAWTGSIDVAIAQVRQDGSLQRDLDTTIALKLTDDQRQSLLDSGLTLTRHLAIASNTVQVAVVIRDTATGALGSVFVPAAKLRNAR